MQVLKVIMDKVTNKSPKNETKTVKIIIKILFGIGVLGLIGFMTAFIAMLTHYNLFKN